MFPGKTITVLKAVNTKLDMIKEHIFTAFLIEPIVGKKRYKENLQ